MNIPKNKDETFYADINIFFSTYLPVYIHKVLTLHFINRELIAFSHLIGLALIMKIINSQSSTFPSVHNGLIKQKYGLITYPARKIVFIC